MPKIKSKKSAIISGSGITIRKRRTARGTTKLFLEIRQKLGQEWKKTYDFESLSGLELTGDKDKDTEIMEIAKSIMIKRQAQLNGKQYTASFSVNRKSNFIDYVNSKIELSEARKGSKDGGLRNSLYHLKNFAGDRILFRDINDNFLNAFKLYLIKNLKNNSAATYLERVKGLLNQAVKERVIEVNPFQYVDMIRRRKTLRAFLTIDELQVLAKTECKAPEVKRAFLFASFSGMRLSDVKNLTWKDVGKEHIEFVQKKTNSPVYIPFSSTLTALLGKRGARDQKVFNLKGDENTRRMLKDWVKDAGIEKEISFHNSRHSFAVNAIDSEVNIKVLSVLLGHSSVRITEIYTTVTDEAKNKAMKKIPGIEI